MTLLVPHGWLFVFATVVLAAAIDVAFGEPPNAVHPVVWMGRLIGALERRRPRSRPGAELAWGVLIVVCLTGASAAAGVGLLALLAWLPWWLALPVGAAVLKTTFSLRGLVGAGRDIQRALAGDTEAARDGLAALVSRDRNLEPPQIVSATVESLAENLTDSVVSPLAYFALFGLPGALVYRAVNTMDAMIGYRGEYEYVGKAAARADDVLNWLPARLTGLLLVAVAGVRRSSAAAWETLVAEHCHSSSPNKLWTIAPMAGALGVRLTKPGVYAVGAAGRPLTAGVIGEAIVIIWEAGGVVIAAAAALAALMAWGVWA